MIVRKHKFLKKSVLINKWGRASLSGIRYHILTVSERKKIKAAFFQTNTKNKRQCKEIIPKDHVRMNSFETIRKEMLTHPHDTCH